MVVYKPHGVGWLSCLSQWKGNAKARYGGISKEVSPTSFLCPYADRIHNRSINLMLKRGEW